MVNLYRTVKNQKARRIFMFSSLPIVMIIIVLSTDSNLLRSVINLDTREISDWFVKKSGAVNPSVTKPISFNKIGVVFDEKMTPKWGDTYGIFLLALQKNIKSDDYYANLLIEISQINADGSSTQILTKESNHQTLITRSGNKSVFSILDFSSRLPKINNKHPLSLMGGATYVVRIINKTIGDSALDIPYYIEVSTNHKPK